MQNIVKRKRIYLIIILKLEINIYILRILDKIIIIYFINISELNILNLSYKINENKK